MGPVATCVGMTRMETSSPDVIDVEFITSAAELKVSKVTNCGKECTSVFVKI